MSTRNEVSNRRGSAPADAGKPADAGQGKRRWHAPALKELDMAMTAHSGKKRNEGKTKTS